MMRLDEAIKYCEEVAKLKEYRVDLEEEIAYARLEAPTNDMRPMAEIEKLNRDAERYRQLAEWLRELKAYREILANADKIIESQYGCVIIEGYADVVDQMIEIYMEVNADEESE